MKELVQIECRAPFPHVIDSTHQGMRQDGQGLALTMLFLHAGAILPGGNNMPRCRPAPRAQPLRTIYPLTRLMGIVVSCVMA
jgi:hypothetical protein